MLKKKKNQIFCVLQQKREKTTIAKADAVLMFWINCEEVNERITNKIGKRIYYRNSIEERKRKFFWFKKTY